MASKLGCRCWVFRLLDGEPDGRAEGLVTGRQRALTLLPLMAYDDRRAISYSCPELDGAFGGRN